MGDTNVHIVIITSSVYYKATATTELYTLSLHDALPICLDVTAEQHVFHVGAPRHFLHRVEIDRAVVELAEVAQDRSEEHTSELQSPCNLVCRLLLEKKKEED